MPDLLMGLLVVLVLSASMSTLSALVMTSSSTLTLDVLKGKYIREMDIKSQIMSIRLLIVVFVCISTVIAIVQYNSPTTFIAQLMSISWGALAGSFLGPFLYGLYWQRTTTASVWACFIFAVALVCVSMVLVYMGVAKINLINVGALAMLAGLVIVPLVSWLTPHLDAERTSTLFRESYRNLHDMKIDAD
jgi:Na+/proline symporter